MQAAWQTGADMSDERRSNAARSKQLQHRRSVSQRTRDSLAEGHACGFASHSTRRGSDRGAPPRTQHACATQRTVRDT